MKRYIKIILIIALVFFSFNINTGKVIAENINCNCMIDEYGSFQERTCDNSNFENDSNACNTCCTDVGYMGGWLKVEAAGEDEKATYLFGVNLTKIISEVELFFSSLIWKLFLGINKIVYLVLAVMYEMIGLAANLNTGTLANIVAPVLSKVTAVIIVIVVYNMAVTIIRLLTDTKDATKKSSALLRNIFITAALLITYRMFFGIMNEVTLLIIGNKTNYQFPYLSQIADIDPSAVGGVIEGFIFDLSEEERKEMGATIACDRFHEFFGPEIPCSSREDLKNLNSDENVKLIVGTVNEKGFIEKVDGYCEPRALWFVGLIVAGYLAYTFFNVAIQVVLRMFKLLLLEILAPLPIASILTKGYGDNSRFSKYLETLLSVFLEVFMRLFTVYLVIYFMTKAIAAVPTLVPNSEGTNLFTHICLTMIIIIALCYFLDAAPALIDKALGTEAFSSFGHMGSALLGGAGGAAGGFLGGLFSGKGLGRLTGAVGGAAGGALSGLKSGFNSKDGLNSKGASISEAMKTAYAGDTYGQKLQDKLKNADKTPTSGFGVAAGAAGSAIANKISDTVGGGNKLNTISDDVNSLEEENNSLGEQSGNIEEANKNLEDSNKALENTNQELQGKIKDVSKKQVESDRRVADAQGKLDKVDTVSQNISDKHDAMVTANNNLKDAYSTTMKSDSKITIKDKSGASITENASDVYSSGYENIQVGADKEAYVNKIVEHDKALQIAQAKVERAVANGASAPEIAKLNAELKVEMQEAKQRAGDYYDSVVTTEVVNASTKATAEYNAAVESVDSGIVINESTGKVDVAASKTNYEKIIRTNNDQIEKYNEEIRKTSEMILKNNQKIEENKTVIKENQQFIDNKKEQIESNKNDIETLNKEKENTENSFRYRHFNKQNNNK